MQGFTGVIRGEKHQRLIRTYGQYNRKFPEDKVNRSDDAYDIMFDGVLLNGTALRLEYEQENLGDLLVALWKKHGTKMLSILKGSYVLCLWDKGEDTVVVTGDRLNKRPLYYHLASDAAYFSSRYLDLVSLLAENKIFPDYSPAAFAMMQSVGQLYEQFTPLQTVYCLRPYEYLLCRNGQTTLEGGEWFVEESKFSEKELMARFDELFAEAVRLQYEKNAECGYEQVASLSGGMDTRSTVLMGQRLGYGLDRSFCYSQTGSADETIARKLAKKLSVSMDFLPLDGGAFLLRAEDHGRCNECLISYAGSTGALTMAESMSMDSVGIIHSGLFGGEIMASIFLASDRQKPTTPFSGAGHEEFMRLVDPQLSNSRVGFRTLMRGCFNFVRMFESKTEVISPFLDEDVYEFCLTLPFSMRKSRLFYARWMKRNLPNNLATTYFRLPMNAPDFLLWFIPRFLGRVPIYMKAYDMHPMQDWYNAQPALRQGMDDLVDKYARNALPEEIKSPLLEQCRCGEPRKIMFGITGLLAACLTEEAQRN